MIISAVMIISIAMIISVAMISISLRLGERVDGPEAAG
jgi:hypothetical protein